jgi:hypothetical protein
MGEKIRPVSQRGGDAKWVCLGLCEFYVDYVGCSIDASKFDFYRLHANHYIDASKFLLRKILPTRCFSERKTVLVFITYMLYNLLRQGGR